ncbi:asparagine synthase (glutamine-hydrolyzing) [Anaeromyxobacter paludicola]|uniref:asparagine synthase (glutamine-hydrolyzing) n=1 Tax=Anaeromyxobacter paludicola TaxID=2918171 RepID=UPI0020BE1F3E|nr:asparagine synthase (glutamine-hydrolyzing) [Anaeromyxobacter paludicola]
MLGRSALLEQAEVEPELAGALAHRGPDSFGQWRDGRRLMLLHWRLAVIDLSEAGRQPMTSRDGRWVLCYNGEVYNYALLAQDVERAAARDPAAPPGGFWRGHSDSEVIVEGCARFGPGFLQRLDGMYALALFDTRERTLYLARDPAGIKPLYVHQRPDLLLFASEAKVFFHVPEFRGELDATGLNGYLRYGHAYDGAHVLGGVRQLEPGELLTCRLEEGGAVRVESSRLRPRPTWRPVARSDREAARALRDLLGKVVERQLVADVPVGVLLSGGVDSSILTALTARLLGPGRTMAFTLGYPGMGQDFDEVAYARRVARHLGVRHHVYEARSDDLVRDLEQLVWHYDEPFADAAGLNVFLLSRDIRRYVTVALAGEGADELFGGYRRYQLEQAFRAAGPLGAVASWVARTLELPRLPKLPRRAQVLLRVLACPDAASRYSGYLQSGVSAAALLRPEWRRALGVHPRIVEGCQDGRREGVVSRLCLVDQQFWLPTTYLEKSDKAAMAHSLEIRVPYLDDEVVEFANSLPDRQRIRGVARKWLLREAFGDLLPGEVFRRFKRGFGVPVARWLRGELRAYYADRVLSPAARVARYLETGRLEQLYREHLRGEQDRSFVLWQCLVLELWLRHFEQGFQSAAPPRARAGVA